MEAPCDILADLNPVQRQAACHTEGPLLILAGAGSGKTRVLTHRIAYLIGERAVFPDNILAVTFTNKAANEMRDRVARLVGPWSRSIWVSTFHAFCARVLRRDIDKLGISTGFTIFDEADQKSAMKRALKELGIDETRFQPESVLAAVSSAKNELIDPEEYEKRAHGFWEETVARAYRVYQRVLRESSGLDFDDLLVETVRLFKEHPTVLQWYQRQLKYILVDEYQDTNHAQYELVNLLSAEHRNICVCGDPDQSIYGWRGADIRNILEFEKDYPDATVIKLEQNYRSTQVILDIANKVISRNRSRKEKNLWTANGRGHEAVYYEAWDERDEASFVASEIEQALRRGRRSKDFAILYRTNAQSRVFEETLLGMGLPYKVVGGLRFYERKEIKDILAYLKLVLNPDDLVSLSRVVNVPRRGVGEATLAKYVTYAREAGVPLAFALDDAQGAVSGVTSKARTALSELASLIRGLAEVADTLPVFEIAKRIIDGSGYIEALRQERTVEADTRAENIKELLSVTREFDSRDSEHRGLAGFIEEITLATDVDLLSEEQEGVTLMTLHSAKGLEFPVVFLVGMEEGLFPHARTLDDEDELEEERRLCYVGITRAKEGLYFTRARQRLLYGEIVVNDPSRFLEDVPEHLCREVLTRPGVGWGLVRRTITLSTWNEKSDGCDPRRSRDLGHQSNEGVDAAAMGRPSPGEPVPAHSYNPGDRVKHREWGVGTVLTAEGEGRSAIITVEFESLGVKRLAVAYAPIEPER
ncbi:MAG: DNA helicase PcrA [Firmicutes bacterium]|jgi:DNA helicase-2/ATP-dependent DNA helicase PcrA|nr:DNA helicase PcrA [Bacillota bacterium]MDH7494561.1 DNA helicase PcrA [Bacillota bacterium]